MWPQVHGATERHIDLRRGAPEHGLLAARVLQESRDISLSSVGRARGIGPKISKDEFVRSFVERGMEQAREHNVHKGM